MRILGLDYTLDTSKTSAEIGAYGRCHFGAMTIQVASDLPQHHQESVLLHEIVEALNYQLELGLEHRVIMSLEAGLFQVLRDGGVSLAGMLK